MLFLEPVNIIQIIMNKHSGKTNRDLIEMLIDQGQQLYAVVSDISRRLTSVEKRLDLLEVKVDRLIDNDNELFEWRKRYIDLSDNHEFRITKLETI